MHLGYAVDEFPALLDGELYLPQRWAADRSRCQAAGMPAALMDRPQGQIALELSDRAGNGVRFEWLTFAEGYGRKPALLRELSARQQRFVAEVPRSLTGG